MNVAFLSFYSGLVERGVERIVKELSTELRSYCTVDVYDADSVDFKKSNIASSTSKFFLDRQSRAVFLATKNLLPQLRKRHYDIIVPWNNRWQLLLTKMFTPSRIVAIGQSGIGWDDRFSLYTFPSHFVGLTTFQSDWAHSVNPFVPISTISNGVRLSTFTSKGLKFPLSLPRPIIASVGALTSFKRHDLAIRAVSKLQKGSLVIVGKGEEYESLNSMGKELLGDKFSIISVPFSDMPKFMRSIDLLTFPTSPVESFGLVLLEAMASNIPIVTTNDPIRKEIVSNAGYFVDPTQITNYSKAIESALETPWKTIPRDRAMQFSWKDIAQDYYNLFRKVCYGTQETTR